MPLMLFLDYHDAPERWKRYCSRIREIAVFVGPRFPQRPLQINAKHVVRNLHTMGVRTNSRTGDQGAIVARKKSRSGSQDILRNPVIKVCAGGLFTRQTQRLKNRLRAARAMPEQPRAKSQMLAPASGRLTLPAFTLPPLVLMDPATVDETEQQITPAATITLANIL